VDSSFLHPSGGDERRIAAVHSPDLEFVHPSARFLFMHPSPRLPLVLHEIFMHNRRTQRQHRPMGLCGGRFEGYLGSEITPRDVDRPDRQSRKGTRLSEPPRKTWGAGDRTRTRRSPRRRSTSKRWWRLLAAQSVKLDCDLKTSISPVSSLHASFVGSSHGGNDRKTQACRASPWS